MGKFYNRDIFMAFWWSVWDLLQGFIVKNTTIEDLKKEGFFKDD